jgi:ADP-ribosylglycohydrolase
MDRAILEDKVRGAIFGHAVGDALGLGTEFLSKAQVEDYYPDGLDRYDQIVRDRHRRRWECGEWTDDTDQMLCILDSILAKHEVDAHDIALRIRQWAEQGGMGIGRTVYSVICSEDFLRDPHEAARRVWEASGMNAAANGGVMRTSVLGVWQYDVPETVIRNAEAVCKITHYDPRCVASCVCVSLAISSLLRGASDIDALMGELEVQAASYDERTVTYFQLARESNLASMKLDEGLNPGERNTIGYTLKAMGAGLWSLMHASSYEDGIRRVIHEGGDADTNGAVVGAILGARFGFSELPKEWVDGLLHRAELQQRVQRLLAHI